MNPLRIGTRGSRLALWQAHHVKARLERAHPGLRVELVEITTQGDRIVDRPLAAIGGKGLFVKEIERALLDRAVDLAVHSAKDLPAEMPEGLVLAAVLERERPHDVLVSRTGETLDALPHGARVGTSSLRRRAMLLAARPDLEIVNLRGNVPTRLRKVQEGQDGMHAAVLAYAGMHRLELDAHIAQILAFELMLPAAGQGIVAVQARADDPQTLQRLSALEDPHSRTALAAERAVLALLEGSCHIPLGAHAHLDLETDTLHVEGRLVAPDGSLCLEAHASGAPGDARALGQRVGRELLERGGKRILDAIRGELEVAVSSASLTGVPVIVTRSRAQASQLSTRLAAHGATPIEIPTVEVEPAALQPVADAVARLEDGAFDWLVVTSPNGVEHGLQRALGVRPLRAGTTRIAVVGPATAEALYERTGARADLVPAEHTSEGLLEALRQTGVGAGDRCLMLVAESTRGVLEAGLEDAGATLERVTAYRTKPAREGAQRLAEVLAGEPAGWITFASSSAVESFMALVDDEPARLAGWRIACIGPITARTARERGLQVDVMPAQAGIAELVVALVEHHADAGR